MDMEEDQIEVSVKLPAGPWSFIRLSICRVFNLIPQEVMNALLVAQRKTLERRESSH